MQRCKVTALQSKFPLWIFISLKENVFQCVIQTTGEASSSLWKERRTRGRGGSVKRGRASSEDSSMTSTDNTLSGSWLAGFWWEFTKDVFISVAVIAGAVLSLIYTSAPTVRCIFHSMGQPDTHIPRNVSQQRRPQQLWLVCLFVRVWLGETDQWRSIIYTLKHWRPLNLLMTLWLMLACI